jgi:hypothetical protein
MSGRPLSARHHCSNHRVCLALAVTAEAVAAVTVAAVTAEELAEAEVALMEGQYQGHGP